MINQKGVNEKLELWWKSLESTGFHVRSSTKSVKVGVRYLNPFCKRMEIDKYLTSRAKERWITSRCTCGVLAIAKCH